MKKKKYQCQYCQEVLYGDVVQCPQCGIREPIKIEYEWWFIALWFGGFCAAIWTLYEYFN